MKYTIRIPTEQFAYIETEFEGSRDEAIMEHNALLNEYNLSKTKKENSLTSKEWNAVIDRYLSENKIASDAYDRLSYDEKVVLNEIKKSLNRISKTQTSV